MPELEETRIAMANEVEHAGRDKQAREALISRLQEQLEAQRHSNLRSESEVAAQSDPASNTTPAAGSPDGQEVAPAGELPLSQVDLAYLRNAVYQYMMDIHDVNVTRVIAALLQFDEQQREKVLEKELEDQRVSDVFTGAPGAINSCDLVASCWRESRVSPQAAVAGMAGLEPIHVW